MAARRDVIDNGIDNSLNARPHIFDPPRAERAHYEAAQTAVVGGSSCSIQWLMLR